VDGHLTHGAKPTYSGKTYKSIQYEVNPDNNYEIDYNVIEEMIDNYNPKLFIAGASAYPREIDFKKLREIIDRHNNRLLTLLKRGYKDESYYDDLEKDYENLKTYFMVDMAHIAGLVAAGAHQNPLPYADVVTSTTHKTLRGPRGGIILWNDEKYTKKINSAVFPGVQGGPLENIIAAKAVCFGEALKPEFKEYINNVIENTKTLAIQLTHLGVDLLTQGTDNHLILIDLRKENITGQELENRLEEIGIVTNKNAVPFDTKNKKETSGLRIGTAAVTSRGLGKDEMMTIGQIVAHCIDTEIYELNKEYMKKTIKEICEKYPLYKEN